MKKPFDLQKAIAGHPLIMRDGRKISEFHYFKTSKSVYPCYVIINGEASSITVDGKNYVGGIESNNDLFLDCPEPKMVKGWVNVYKTNNKISLCSQTIFPTLAAALEFKENTFYTTEIEYPQE